MKKSQANLEILTRLFEQTTYNYMYENDTMIFPSADLIRRES